MRTNKVGLAPVLFTVLAVVGLVSVSQAAFDPKDLPQNLKSVSVKGIPVVYTDQGQGDPLVILTPSPFGTGLWAGMAKSLSSSVRVIVVEPPGLRDSSSMRGDFSAVRLLEVYRDFVKALGLSQVHIMGVGESGAMAAAFGHHWPEIVASVVSINGFEGANWTEGFEKTLNYFKQPSEAGINTLLSAGSLKYKKQAPSRQELDGMVVSLQEEDQKSAHQARFKAYVDDVKMGIILMMMPNLNRDLLLIRSEGDELVSQEFVERTRNLIRKASIKYVLIPQAGHFAFIDQPDKVTEAVRAFLLDHRISK
jgi:pimeloyl-ACP methyl ester carboxylesterase